MDNQTNQNIEAQPDTTGPSEIEMPDASAIDARIESGELRRDAEAAFSTTSDTDSSDAGLPAQEDSILTDAAASSGAGSS